MPKKPGAAKRLDQDRDRSAVVAPDPACAPAETTSKFWGVSWDKKSRRWKAAYRDANKQRYIGLFDTQEAAAHAVNAAVRRLGGPKGRRKTNPVVDGQLVPRVRNANGHGPRYSGNKRLRKVPAAATPSTRARRRPRRAVNYAEDTDFEP